MKLLKACLGNFTINNVFMTVHAYLTVEKTVIVESRITYL